MKKKMNIMLHTIIFVHVVYIHKSLFVVVPFGHASRLAGSQFPDQGSNSGPCSLSAES